MGLHHPRIFRASKKSGLSPKSLRHRGNGCLAQRACSLHFRKRAPRVMRSCREHALCEKRAKPEPTRHPGDTPGDPDLRERGQKSHPGNRQRAPEAHHDDAGCGRLKTVHKLIVVGHRLMGCACWAGEHNNFRQVSASNAWVPNHEHQHGTKGPSIGRRSPRSRRCCGWPRWRQNRHLTGE